MYNSPWLERTDVQLQALAEDVEAGRKTAKEVGYRGLHLAAQILPYVSFTNLFLMPVCHAILFGIVPKFLDYVFETTTTYYAAVRKHNAAVNAAKKAAAEAAKKAAAAAQAASTAQAGVASAAQQDPVDTPTQQQAAATQPAQQEQQQQPPTEAATSSQQQASTSGQQPLQPPQRSPFVLSEEALKLMQTASGHMANVTEFGRRYHDVEKYR